MKDELERMLAQDAADLREEAERALSSGMERRLSIALQDKTRSFAGARSRWEMRAALASAMTILALVFAVKMSQQRPVAPPPRIATKLPPAALIVEAQAPLQSQLAVRVRRRIKAKAPRVFPSPAPLNGQERELVMLARLEPQQLERLYKDQQSMRADFERGNQEFAEKVAAQNRGEKDDH